MDEKHHILLLGGTGICGQTFTEAALSAGHKLTPHRRPSSKLPTPILSHQNLDVIQGDLANEEGLKEGAACGADVFVSLAGPTWGRRKEL
jgi:nucleoside-diphosphate-sugar epimerase